MDHPFPSRALSARRALLPLVLGLLVPSVALAESRFRVTDIVDVEKDVSEAPTKPVLNLVILSEGYDASRKAVFLEKARTIRKDLREGSAAAPMRDANAFHFYTVWVPSRELGTPWRNAQSAGDTPFGGYVGEDGTLCADDVAVDRAVKHVAPKSGRTVAVVLMHLKSKNAPPPLDLPFVDGSNTSPDDVRPASDTPVDVFKRLAQGSVVEANHLIGRVHQIDNDLEAFVHELGHAAYGLDDEYSNDDKELLPKTSRDGVAEYPNCTTDPTGARWRKLVPDLFRADGTILHIFEGGSGFGQGVWHAYEKCRMNQSRSEDFCPVCAATIRGSRDREKPLAAPTWALVPNRPVPTLEDEKGRYVLLPWKPAAGDQPMSYHVTLRNRAGGLIWERDIEGHHTAARIPLPKNETLTVSIRAQRLAVANPGAGSPEVAMRVRAAANGTVTRTDASATVGMAHAIDH